MDAYTADAHTVAYPLGILLAEGKTKRIYAVKDSPGLVLVVSKDDITAGDGKKHDLLPGKAVLSTTTACNVFEYLASRGIPTAFIERDNVNSFVAQHCDMLPYEVVVRREAHGSYLKRHPDLERRHRFSNLLVEIFLKTSGKVWRDHLLPCDDPLMQHFPEGRKVLLFDPAEPFTGMPFLELDDAEVFTRVDEQHMLVGMSRTARDVFIHLESAWQKVGGTLVDFKVEFGVTPAGTLLLADVIDNDSWRVLWDDEYIDKQVYRDGGELQDVISRYRRVAELTANFSIQHVGA